MIEQGLLPPAAGTTAETLGLPVKLVPDRPLAYRPRYVLKTSSGFGGLHRACVLKVPA